MARNVVYRAALILILMFSVPTRDVLGYGPQPIQSAPATPQLQSLLAEGSEALQRGDDPAAENAFRRALILEPQSVEILNDLAISLVKQGKLVDAIPFYKRALLLKPGDITTTRNLAIAYFKQQNFRQALPLLQALNRRQPEDFQVLDLEGLSLFGLDRYPEAARYLERASNRRHSTNTRPLNSWIPISPVSTRGLAKSIGNKGIWIVRRRNSARS